MSQPGYLSCAGCGRMFKERNPVEMRAFQQHSCEDENSGWPSVTEQAVLVWQTRNVRQAFALLSVTSLDMDAIANSVPIQDARKVREWWTEMKRKHTMVDL